MKITYGFEKFHHFIYGRHVFIETDHKPLTAISSKDIGDMPLRLQLFFLRMLIYEYKLQFIPGKELVLADMLSRAAPAASGDSSGFTDVQVHAVGILSSLVSGATKLRFPEKTSNDPELQKVVENISGNKGVEGELKLFACKLYLEEGILLKCYKVVLPKKLRPEKL